MEDKRTATTKVVKRIFPHEYLEMASLIALDQAKAAPRGRFSNILSSMVMSAFSLEAFLNLIGQEKIKTWGAIERQLGLEPKLLLLAEVLNYPLDRGQRPFQTFGRIVKFRNLIVHAKPEIYESVTVEEILDADIRKSVLERRPWDYSLPESKWIQECTLDNAERFLEDTQAIIKELITYTGLMTPGPEWIQKTSTWLGPLFSPGSGSDEE